ncbi:MAG: hypothetical protein IPL22_07930 [Bacteroidetes bacterium]|nr:hypothetical protein [Bacteroidota bacterium]
MVKGIFTRKVEIIDSFGPDLIGVNLYDGFGSAVLISADGTRAAISP